MSSPFISICIPTYKRTGLLKKLLDSLVLQTYRDFEILINDNSPDTSVQTLLYEYTDHLPIDYEKNNPTVNAVKNCIKVIRRAKGSWVKIMHDDDWFATADALQQFADAAKKSGKDFIFAACNYVDLQTGEIETARNKQADIGMLDKSIFSLFYLNVIGHPSAVMHKKDPLIEYDANFNWVLDIDFYMRYLEAHKGIHYLSNKIINIGKGPTQESYKYYKNSRVEIPEYFRLLSKYTPDLALRNRYVFHLIWNMIVRYKIENEEQIKALGYEGPLPPSTQQIIQCQKYIPRIILKQPRWSKIFMNRCFEKHSIRV